MGRFIKRIKKKREEKRHGEGAFIRIQNKSSKTVKIKIIESKSIDN